MKGMLIPTNGNPVEIDIKVDETGSTLHDLQRLVGGNIEPFDVIFGEGISLYVNEDGRVTLKGEAQASRAASEKLDSYISHDDHVQTVR